MSTASDPIPPKGVDLDHPSIARVYDYFLGGTANWAIDRELGDRLISRVPIIRDIAVANRMFLNRAVRYLAKAGVRQFLDIGSGVPTVGNTHEVADEIAPDSRVVYVDYEPVAVAHSQMILEEDGDPRRQAAILGDLREPDRVWETVAGLGILNLDEPVAVLMLAVLHAAQPGPDGEDVSAASVARYRELMAPGSYLVISHATDDGVSATRAEEMAAIKMMFDASSNGVLLRSRPEINAFMGDFELVEPGMTWTPDWHAEEPGGGVQPIEIGTGPESAVWAGVARKP
ncbi:SAM-dependent methyltransferase [Labedaea rhizosphaerae]|uniref:S-adenosyl methyltransferase n=1 Tax=Labedaea rhizosphaerae TaxID=598644 RepID=A0A4R6SLX9_LABRH|nr:SAM-dependent methyltransferase [Labedaea rhizosphaerae]TDQ04322.1 S-adenosyl methyltransferase [Labedaea rhizosphaerae]